MLAPLLLSEISTIDEVPHSAFAVCRKLFSPQTFFIIFPKGSVQINEPKSLEHVDT